LLNRRLIMPQLEDLVNVPQLRYVGDGCIDGVWSAGCVKRLVCAAWDTDWRPALMIM
jgi:hypothetical protein